MRAIPSPNFLSRPFLGFFPLMLLIALLLTSCSDPTYPYLVRPEIITGSAPKGYTVFVRFQKGDGTPAPPPAKGALKAVLEGKVIARLGTPTPVTEGGNRYLFYADPLLTRTEMRAWRKGSGRIVNTLSADSQVTLLTPGRTLPKAGQALTPEEAYQVLTQESGSDVGLFLTTEARKMANISMKNVKAVVGALSAEPEKSYRAAYMLIKGSPTSPSWQTLARKASREGFHLNVLSITTHSDLNPGQYGHPLSVFPTLSDEHVILQTFEAFESALKGLYAVTFRAKQEPTPCVLEGAKILALLPRKGWELFSPPQAESRGIHAYIYGMTRENSSVCRLDFSLSDMVEGTFSPQKHQLEVRIEQQRTPILSLHPTVVDKASLDVVVLAEDSGSRDEKKSISKMAHHILNSLDTGDRAYLVGTQPIQEKTKTQRGEGTSIPRAPNFQVRLRENPASWVPPVVSFPLIYWPKITVLNQASSLLPNLVAHNTGTKPNLLGTRSLVVLSGRQSLTTAASASRRAVILERFRRDGIRLIWITPTEDQGWQDTFRRELWAHGGELILVEPGSETEGAERALNALRGAHQIRFRCPSSDGLVELRAARTPQVAKTQATLGE